MRNTGFYYYGARYYNPRESLWLSVDPLAEKYPSMSPYIYVANNPINAIDPDGRDIIFIDYMGDVVYTIKSDIIHETYVHDFSTPLKSRAISGFNSNGAKGWIKAKMPNIISKREGIDVTGAKYQQHDHQIAARTSYFNQGKKWFTSK